MRFHFPFFAALAALVSAPALQAHISWSGSRNFDVLGPGDTRTSDDRTISGRFGWADGADANLGDSHRLTYFRFVLEEPRSVTISLARNDIAGQSGAFGIFLPAFSLYRIDGTMPANTHDGSSHTVQYLTGLFGGDALAEAFDDANGNHAWDVGESFTDANGNGVWDSAGLGGSGKEGSFNALGDWRIYNDAGQYGQFIYIGGIADGTSANYGSADGIHGDGIADGFVSLTFTDLLAGEYFIAVGGADYLAQNTEGPTSFPTYGVAVTVSVIPEPAATGSLAGLAAFGLYVLRRRRSAR